MEICVNEMPNDVPRELSAFAEHQDGNANHSPVDEEFGYDEGSSNIKSVCVYPTSLKNLLYQYPCCPPDAFTNIKEFYLNSRLNTILEEDKKCKVALRNWCAIIRDWSINEFVEYYNKPNVKPYFNAYARGPGTVYYDIDRSVSIASELLMYQFENNEGFICRFLQTLVNILDKKIPKRNSMLIHSPPSAGKNYFFDAVAAFFLNYGMFGTANKTNNFSFSDGAGKRLVIWNEPNYEVYHLEKMKELLGGDTTRVHVKYKNDVPLQGPPIILLTNHYLSIINDPSFKDRLSVYTWISAPFLKMYDKKLSPLFFYHLLNKYNIIYY